LTTPAPVVDARESLQRLAELLMTEELEDLVHAIETIVQRSGYGEIVTTIKNRRVDKITISETLKPRVK